MTTTPKTPIEHWLEDNLPEGATFYRMGELPPDLKATFAAHFAETLAHETDPDVLAAAEDLKRRMGIRAN